MKTVISTILSLLMAVPVLAQERSAKRGIGWDEKTQPISEQAVSKMAPGVSWIYNWGTKPRNTVANLGREDGMEFVPMCWNANFDEAELRRWLTDNPGVRYLLGFNEPNFSAQANMTPAQAVQAWPRLEKIAADFGLKLVAPALNFTGERVGGRTWSPYEWLDEFFRLYPDARVDCLALHCYMNWFSANTWFATEYFYADLYNPAKNDVYGRYPNIVKYLDAYRAANGHFPRMMLTEFCSWENDGTVTGVDFQIDQMTQKVQKLEQSDLVEGYAWFMANACAADYPYFSIFDTNRADSPLSTLGTVYTYMSAFDTNKFYQLGETVDAKDYVDASTDDQQVRLRPNTDGGSAHPLQVEMGSGAWAKYQLNIPAAGVYTFRLRLKSSSDIPLWLYVDGKKNVASAIASTQGIWADRDFTATLQAGNHSIMLYNAGTDGFYVNTFSFETDASAIGTVISGGAAGEPLVCSIDGMAVGRSLQGMSKGVYIVITPDGKRTKTLIK